MPGACHHRRRGDGGQRIHVPVSFTDRWGWRYVLRQKGIHLLQLTPAHPWQRCDTFVTQPFSRLWLTNISLTQQHCSSLSLSGLVATW